MRYGQTIVEVTLFKYEYSLPLAEFMLSRLASERMNRSRFFGIDRLDEEFTRAISNASNTVKIYVDHYGTVGVTEIATLGKLLPAIELIVDTLSRAYVEFGARGLDSNISQRIHEVKETHYEIYRETISGVRTNRVHFR